MAGKVKYPVKIEQVNRLSPFNIVITVIASNGVDTYDIGVMYFLNEDRWEIVQCNCDGWTNRMYCRHTKARVVLDYIAGLPRPASPGPQLQHSGHFYECEICKNRAFYICPPYNKRGITQAVCTQCGRGYEVIC